MPELKRRLRRIDGLAIALGTVIGIGLFRNTGTVLRGTGGFTGATLLWVIGGVLVLGGAVLYADVSSRVPEAGGPYASSCRVPAGVPSVTQRSVSKSTPLLLAAKYARPLRTGLK